MATSSETKGGLMDTLRWVAAAVVLIASVLAFYEFKEHSQLLRIVGVLLALGVATAIVWTTAVGQNTRVFMSDSKIEVRKVVWPSRAETQQTTLAVFVAVLVVGILLWLMDMFFLWAVGFVTGQGG